MRYLALMTFSLLALSACGDTYRYPCQNPAKAKTAECQCDAQPRTKNKALNAVETATTTTIPQLAGFDC